MKYLNTNKLASLIAVIGIVALYFQYTNLTKEKVYRLNTECAKKASDFVKEKNSNGIMSWEVLQSLFDSKSNSCFAEFASSDGISLIYDLTHSKEFALYPANSGKLFSGVSGGEKSEVRIELIRKYKELREEIFKNK